MIVRTNNTRLLAIFCILSIYLPFALNTLLSQLSLSVSFVLTNLTLGGMMLVINPKLAKVTTVYGLIFIFTTGIIGFISANSLNSIFTCIAFLLNLFAIMVLTGSFTKDNIFSLIPIGRYGLALGYVLILVSVILNQIFKIKLPEIALQRQNVVFLGEISLVIVILVPFLMVKFVNKQNLLIDAIFLLGIGFLFPSAIALLSGLIVLSVFVMERINLRLLVFTISILLIGVAYVDSILQLDYFARRFATDLTMMNMSSLQYWGHWSEVLHFFSQLKLLGEGLGAKTTEFIDPEIRDAFVALYGSDLFAAGANAGHFFVSRLTISLGLLQVIAFVVFIGWLLVLSLKRKRTRYFFSLVFLIPELLLRTTGLLGPTFLWLLIISACIHNPPRQGNAS